MARYVVHVRSPKPAAGAYDVTVKALRGSLTLRCHITDHDPPDRVVARARSRFLTSLDTITVRDDANGSMVTYDAELTLNGILGVADPPLGSRFKRIGDRAATGLVRVLEGEEVKDPPP